MNQTLADALSLAERLQNLRNLPPGKVMHFAFLPGDDVLILNLRTKQDRQKAAATLRETEHGGEVDSAWCGDVWWGGDHAVFRVDPKRSSGTPMNVKTFRTALLTMARELKAATALRDPEIVRDTDKVMRPEDLRVGGGEEGWKAKLGKGSPYHRILDELKDLGKSRSNEERREQLDTILRRIDRWFGDHGEDIGDGGDKTVRAAALEHLQTQVVDELARTLREGRLEPSEDERQFALRSLNRSATLAQEAPNLYTLGTAAQRIERWAGLGVRVEPEVALTVGHDLGTRLSEHPEGATVDQVKAASRFVRRMRLDAFNEEDPGRRMDLLLTQIELLEGIFDGLDAVVHCDAYGDRQLEMLTVASRELIKVERDLAALRKQRDLQQQIDLVPESITFTGENGPTGQSGSYFVRNQQGEKDIVFKPLSQESSQIHDPNGPGVGARGEVLGYRFSELLGKGLGIQLNVPRTDMGLLHSERFGEYNPNDSQDEAQARAPQQLGVMQQFVRVSHGDINQYYVFRDEELGVEVSQLPPDTASLNERLRLAFVGHPTVNWDELGELEREALLNRVCNLANTTVHYPEDIDQDEFSEGLNHIALLDLFTLQTDRNPGNVLIDHTEVNGETHTRLIPIDQALCMPTLGLAGVQFKAGAKDDRKNGFEAWINAPGSNAPLNEALVESVMNLDIDDLIDNMRIEAEQLDESTGGRLPKLQEECLQIQRLSMRAVQYALTTRPWLTRRQLANLILDYDNVPWLGEGGNRTQKSPFGEALVRLIAIKTERIEQILGPEPSNVNARRRAISEHLDTDELLSIADFDEEWNLRLRPSINTWLEAVPM